MCVGVNSLLHFLLCCLSCTHPLIFSCYQSVNHQNNFATNTFLTPTQAVSVNQKTMKPHHLQGWFLLFKRRLRKSMQLLDETIQKNLFKVMSLALAFLFVFCKLTVLIWLAM